MKKFKSKKKYMQGRTTGLIVAIVIVLGVIVFWGNSTYNKIIEAEENVTAKWTLFETQCQRRIDLIPKVVGVFQGYSLEEHEKLEEVAKAQKKVLDTKSNPSNLTIEDLRSFQEAQDGLNLSLSRLIIAGQIYPELKADQHFPVLQAELEGAENRITVARNRFNEETKKYNILIRTFPNNVVASIFEFSIKPYFNSQENLDKMEINVSLIIGVVMLLLIIWLLVWLFIWTKNTYNSMVESEETVTAEWARVETQYQRRMDLIPNLVEVVKGYATHEQQTLTDVIEARSKVASINIDPSKLTEESLQLFQKAQDKLGSALSRLMIIKEVYPDLKADRHFSSLQSELASTENGIASARDRFNGVAKVYNILIRTFPKNFIANMFNFMLKPYFKSQEGAEIAPKVKF